MERIRERAARWIRRWAPAEFATFAVGAIVIAVVPGALTIWIAWRLLRARSAS